MPPPPNTTTCKGCGLDFSSKNAVFRHLKETDGACLSSEDHADFLQYVVNCQREKVIVLYGYWLPPIQQASISDRESSPAIRNGEDVAQFLVDTMEQYPSGQVQPSKASQPATANSNPTASTTKVNRSYGHTRSDIVAQESGTSAITEVLCTKLPPLLGGGATGDIAAHREVTARWIRAMNAVLKERLDSSSNDRTSQIEIRVLGRHTMTLNHFNAEVDVSHRRVEYLIPAEFLLPESRVQDILQLPSFSDGLRSRKFTNSANQSEDAAMENEVEDEADDGGAPAVEDSTSHELPYCESPSPEILTLLTSFKRKMQSLTTQIVDLDTNDAAAVMEKQSHSQKRQRNRDYRNNKANAADKAQATMADTEENDEAMTGDDVEKSAKQHNGQGKGGNSTGKKKRNTGGPAKKKEMVLRRKRYHNFTPTVMAHDFLAYRRMNRFYHRATLRFDPSPSSLGDGNSHASKNGERNTTRPFLALSLSGDLFLTGQACHAVGLFIALARQVIDEEFINCVFDERYPHLVPTPPAPTFAMYAADVYYMSAEGKAKAILTPRKTERYYNGWNDDETIQNVRDWQAVVRENVARVWLNSGADADGRLLAEKEWTETVLNPWVKRAKKQLEEYKCWKNAASSGADGIIVNDASGANAFEVDESEHVQPSSILPALGSIDPTVPPVFKKVLYYLRQADANGLWPSTTLKRQLVMISNVADTESNESAGATASTRLFTTSLSVARRRAKLNDNKERSSAYAFVEGQGGASGSFSLGAMPGDKCIQPKGNSLFPELMKAAFELEVALCPHREPSSTIAVNRNAQFRPHTDSGAGAGQSTSLIVGLGTYSGGELMVEGNKMDIRYKAVEFDGWKQRHWTMPFAGERFSLVWFTPKGCEGVNFVQSVAAEIPFSDVSSEPRLES